MPSDGTRSKTGCLPCRRRRHKCDEQKPVCTGCRRSRDQRTCVWPSTSDTARFVVSEVPQDVFLLPSAQVDEGDFITMTRDELARLCDDEERQVTFDGGDDGVLHAEHAVLSLRTQPSALDFSSPEVDLVQYYSEVISNSRVYVPGDYNLFQSLVMPIVLFQGGPLRSTVMCLSAAERTKNSYGDVVLHYKQKALHDLQSHLDDPSRAEENLLACVLQASVEISSGSKPAWLRHLRGSLAILSSFQSSMSDAAAEFALVYFSFRFILMKTTMELSPSMVSEDDLEAEEVASLERDVSLAIVKLVESYSGPASKMIDKHIGCSIELVGAIAQTSNIASELRFGTRTPMIDHQIQGLDTMLYQATFYCGELDAEYLLASAECFRLAARVYLRLVCYESTITNTTVVGLEDTLLGILSQVIRDGQPRRSFPMWPLFIAGCVSSNEDHRKTVTTLFRILDSKWPVGNISTVWNVIWTIWQSRDLGVAADSSQHSQDWQQIIQRFKWKLALS